MYAIYEEVSENFLAETHVDRFLYHKFLDIVLIDNRIVRVSKVSNKKNFAFKLY